MPQPRNIDSHNEATDVKIDLILHKVNHIETLLYGNGDKEGLRIDVDRLKQSHANIRTFVYVIFTALIGTVATVIAQTFSH